MIFITVGHQMPFDRLVQTVDTWAGKNSSTDIFGQIGKAKYRPKNFVFKEFLDASDFRKKMDEADYIVSHAGTGTILTASEMHKPILVMPRLSRLMETRNDHQVSTAERFAEMGSLAVAMNESELTKMLDKLHILKASTNISVCASQELIDTIKNFIQRKKK